jgi:hypothetical protein
MITRTFSDLDADYQQFVIYDAACGWAELYEKWTPQTISARVAPGNGYVGVYTARPGATMVSICVADAEPVHENKLWDAQAETMVSLPTGELVISGVTDGGVTGGRVQLQPGTYKLRVLFFQQNAIHDDGLSGDDSYTVELWPVSARGS